MKNKLKENLEKKQIELLASGESGYTKGIQYIIDNLQELLDEKDISSESFNSAFENFKEKVRQGSSDMGMYFALTEDNAYTEVSISKKRMENRAEELNSHPHNEDFKYDVVPVVIIKMSDIYGTPRN